MIVGRERIRELFDEAGRATDAGEGDVEMLFSAGRQSVTRFAENRIHQNVAEEDAGASFRIAMGGCVGGARTNGDDPERLAACARRAAGIARVQPEDTEFPGLRESPAAPDRGLADYDEQLATLSPRDSAMAVAPAVDRARAEGLEASGSLTVGSGELAVANSLGTFQYHVSTEVALHVVARKGSVEGAWTQTAGRWSDIDPERVAARAVEKAVASRDPVELEKGEYPVVLEADAVADMIEMLAYMGLGGLSVLEERSFLCGKIGERIASDGVTVSDSPFHPLGEARPFDYEGVPKKRLVLVERGVARTPVYDTRTARRAGVESTGHALPEPNTFGPYPLNLVLEPGEATLDEMIASTGRGVLVSRFHYTNPVDPRRTVITGMTRFGTFLIEDGKVAKPVRSMRFTDSVVDALGRVEAVGADLRRAGDVLAPALKLSSWRFTGVTGE
jgi:predicted Zn-dependent protease